VFRILNTYATVKHHHFIFAEESFLFIMRNST